MKEIDELFLKVLPSSPLPEFSSEKDSIEHTFPAWALKPEITSVARLFDQIAWVNSNDSISSCMSGELFGEVKLVAEEIIANVIHYANLPKNEHVWWRLTKLKSGGVLLEFMDKGRPFNPLVESEGAELGLAAEEVSIGGLGVEMVKGVCKRCIYQHKQGYNHFIAELAAC